MTNHYLQKTTLFLQLCWMVRINYLVGEFTLLNLSCTSQLWQNTIYRNHTIVLQLWSCISSWNKMLTMAIFIGLHELWIWPHRIHKVFFIRKQPYLIYKVHDLNNCLSTACNHTQGHYESEIIFGISRIIL